MGLASARWECPSCGCELVVIAQVAEEAQPVKKQRRKRRTKAEIETDRELAAASRATEKRET